MHYFFSVDGKIDMMYGERKPRRTGNHRKHVCIFSRALDNAKSFNGPTSSSQRVPFTTLFFHLQYHLQDPPSSALQRIWQEELNTPRFSAPLADIKNLRHMT